MQERKGIAPHAAGGCLGRGAECCSLRGHRLVIHFPLAPTPARLHSACSDPRMGERRRLAQDLPLPHLHSTPPTPARCAALRAEPRMAGVPDLKHGCFTSGRRVEQRALFPEVRHDAEQNERETGDLLLMPFEEGSAPVKQALAAEQHKQHHRSDGEHGIQTGD